jgi:hypothetical protein
MLTVFAHPAGAVDYVVEARLGLGSPVGFAGLGVEVAPYRWLAASVGTGWGFSGGPQWSGMGRLQVPIGKLALGLGGGMSGGPTGGGLGEDQAEWDHGLWVNGEATLTYRLTDWLRVRGALGFARLLNETDCHWDGGQVPARPCTAEEPGEFRMPYLMGGLGYVF